MAEPAPRFFDDFFRLFNVMGHQAQNNSDDDVMDDSGEYPYHANVVCIRCGEVYCAHCVEAGIESVGKCVPSVESKEGE